MTRVIERCPSCGVEHDVQVDGCEACGSALRWWCRAHSREIGWLETAECRRCVQEEARRTMAALPPVPVAVRPAPDPRFLPAAPGRTLREILDDGRTAPVPRKGGKATRVLADVAAIVLLVVGASALLASLAGFAVLPPAGGVADGPLGILAFTCLFMGGLVAVALAVNVLRRPRGADDSPMA